MNTRMFIVILKQTVAKMLTSASPEDLGPRSKNSEPT